MATVVARTWTSEPSSEPEKREPRLGGALSFSHHPLPPMGTRLRRLFQWTT